MRERENSSESLAALLGSCRIRAERTIASDGSMNLNASFGKREKMPCPEVKPPCEAQDKEIVASSLTEEKGLP